MKGAFRKNGLGYFPADRDAREDFATVKDGEVVTLERKKARFMPMHRGYFATLRNVFEASGRWPSQRAMEYEIALHLKAGESWIGHDGSLRFVPFSRAVSAMPADAFEQLVKDTENLLRSWGYDPAMLREQAA